MNRFYQPKLDLLIIIIEIQNKAMLESKPFAPSKKFIVLKKIKKHKNVKNIELFDKSICLLGILNNSKVVNTKFWYIGATQINTIARYKVFEVGLRFILSSISPNKVNIVRRKMVTVI